MRMFKSLALVAVLALPLMALADDPVTNVTWKSSISLGMTVKQGNIDKTLYTMNLKADRFAPKSDWINSLYGEYGLTEDKDTGEDEQTEGQLRGQSDYRYKFTGEDFYGGVFGEVYHDVLKRIRYRVKLGPNLGYYLINRDNMKLDVSGGINYVHEKNSEETNDSAEYRAAVKYLWDISESTAYYCTVEYSANVEEVEDGSGLLVTGLKCKVNGKLSVFVELRDDYDHMVPEDSDVENNDLTFLAGLTYDIM